MRRRFSSLLLAGRSSTCKPTTARIVIETNDEKIAVMIQKAGGVKIVDQTNKREYRLVLKQANPPAVDLGIISKKLETPVFSATS